MLNHENRPGIDTSPITMMIETTLLHMRRTSPVNSFQILCLTRGTAAVAAPRMPVASRPSRVSVASVALKPSKSSGSMRSVVSFTVRASPHASD